MGRARYLLLAFSLLGASSCAVSGILTRNLSPLFETPREVKNKVREPFRPEARLAVLWVGHATALVQIGDKVILTDPVFTSTVGMVSKRFVEPGLDPENLPPVDAVLISHMHFDHLSLGSLEMIEDKTKVAFVPRGGLVYVPPFRFETVELGPWQTWERGGLKVTPTPVVHSGFRYGIDRDWMTETFTGYVVEYDGIRVYFGGDTAYDKDMFRETGKRFPGIDVALLPIAPIAPRDFMVSKHVDPTEAVQIYQDLGARWMVPIHYDTFVNSLDERGDDLRVLRKVMADRKLTQNEVQILAHGEQRVFLRRPAQEGSKPAQGEAQPQSLRR
ncbi:MBL fold metallo-hydrolase [Chondromyces apiculatus]|uniref:Putative outer membrane protein n=1 Tax=Chondromyces apiculatus DSM 436 TaxID=1192034 RepID=A0A017T5C5_9BACT|nr:MBL fold metallo-hydrolase [Chondromyces apiculatus]EYF03766.1 Putative outer membrane protein [Chondromyces apiculatus DSM 436]